MNIRYQTEISSIGRSDDSFIVTDTHGNEYRSNQLIVATGLSREYIPEIQGIELCDTYISHSLDVTEYEAKRVLVIGKGNSTFEVANHLTASAAVIHLLSPNPVIFAWTSNYVGNLRAVNNNFLDTYQLKSQNAAIDATVNEIEMENGTDHVDISYTHAKGQTRVLDYDRVIVCTGFQFDSSLFDSTCKVDLMAGGKLPAQTTAWESTTIPNLCFAGTLMQACDYKKTMSGFIHGFRHNIRALSWILEERYHDQSWPHDTIQANPEAVLNKVIDRINVSPGIFLQPGFLCDVIVVHDDAGEARCYEEVRLDHIKNSWIKDQRHYYVISLEYGAHHDDPFAVERDPDPAAADEAFYLHPVIRRYERDQLVSIHHINDDLKNHWFLPEYVEPARIYFLEQFDAASSVDRPTRQETEALL